METDDRELVAVMRRYFAAKTELAALTAQLEAERKAAGEEIGMFYDPRQNAERAADQRDKSEAEAEPEEWQSFEKRADTFFGA